MDATIEVFNTITRELLPTPQKSHYTFNLRDMAKVFQGDPSEQRHRQRRLQALISMLYPRRPCVSAFHRMRPYAVICGLRLV